MTVLLTAAVSDRAQQAPAKPASPAQSAPPPQAPPPAAPAQAPPPQGEKAATPQSPQKIIQVVNLVDVLFTVLNRRNKLVPDLQKE
ncbi:MAG TPA: hypothetical protein VFF95_01840, partial [Candidatus Binatus sp.]|nr:hypothetical protein [Candidatus Binatus sp.]